MSEPADTETRIRTRAYYLWLADGCPQGRDLEYWERARELQAIADHPMAGLLPNPAATPSAAGLQEQVVEEAELQENLGEFPSRLTDQGDRPQAPMTRKQARGGVRLEVNGAS